MPEANKKSNKMICPDCGVEMNHHADKVDYTAALSESDSIDPHLGGVLKEAHTCPKCGKTAVRKAA
jgi:ribosomal protein S27AE